MKTMIITYACVSVLLTQHGCGVTWEKKFIHLWKERNTAFGSILSAESIELVIVMKVFKINEM